MLQSYAILAEAINATCLAEAINATCLAEAINATCLAEAINTTCLAEAINATCHEAVELSHCKSLTISHKDSAEGLVPS